jgi:hypothetical protein
VYRVVSSNSRFDADATRRSTSALNVMIFAAETETGELLVFPSEEEATGYCEGLDVEAAIWLFWDEAGNPLEPEFIDPNKRGWFSVENGTYRLVPASENHHAQLLEALEHISSVETNKFFKSVEDVRKHLTHRSTPTPNGVG